MADQKKTEIETDNQQPMYKMQNKMQNDVRVQLLKRQGFAAFLCQIDK